MSESLSTNLFTRIYNKAAGTTSTKPTAKQLEDRDTKAIEAQSKMPMWNQYAIKALDSSIDAASGFLGFGEETKANLAGQLVQAGLPFGAYATKGIKQIFHGTPNSLWTKFNPNVYNKRDVLGHMTHAAEDAAYADRYATKSAWGNSNRKGQRIIPLQPEAKNVLDLVDPNADDISQALAFASPAVKADLIKEFKKIKGVGPLNRAAVSGFRHNYNLNAPFKEMPLRKVAENLQLSPEVTENMPWDAIRYLDEDNKSWAFPKRTPIRTTYGVPMNDAAEMGVSPIKLVRDDNVTTGNFPIISKATQPKQEWAKSPDEPKSLWDQFIDTFSDSQKLIPYDEINSAYTKWEGGLGGSKVNSQGFKPKELIPKKFDKDTWKYNLTIGGKDFPQTKMGIALAKKHLNTMSAITPEQSLKYIKYLDKIKVK